MAQCRLYLQILVLYAVHLPLAWKAPDKAHTVAGWTDLSLASYRSVDLGAVPAVLVVAFPAVLAAAFPAALAVALRAVHVDALLAGLIDWRDAAALFAAAAHVHVVAAALFVLFRASVRIVSRFALLEQP